MTVQQDPLRISPTLELFQQFLGFLQVQHIEVLGEPAVDRGENIVGLLLFALIPPQARPCSSPHAVPKTLPAAHERLLART
jgi:hypothetical protein